jgi:hypothetical protein
VLLKGYDWLLRDEIAAYPDSSQIDPCALAFTPLGDEGNLLENLPTVMEDATIREQEDRRNSARGEIVDGMVSLVPNFPPNSEKYSPQQLREFIEIAGFSQLVLQAKDFAERMVAQSEAVIMDAFPSLR